jgi:tRNA threonylcarbamoyladenosine modification (KEOPS) complex  Pcc1 subunit
LSQLRQASKKNPVKPKRIYRHPKSHPSKTPRPTNLTILIELPNNQAAESVRKSIEPETRPTKNFRSTTTVSSKGKQVCIQINASDLVALRAASNSFLRFVVVALKGIYAVAPFYRSNHKTRPIRRRPEL